MEFLGAVLVCVEATPALLGLGLAHSDREQVSYYDSQTAKGLDCDTSSA